MCGRYVLFSDQDIAEIKNILSEISKKYNDTPYKTGEIYPTDTVPVLTADGPRIMSWGFPRWDQKGVIINAKSETADEKKTFAKPLREGRCVVPSTGFFEWQKKDDSKNKDKYLFNIPNSPLLYMAGLYRDDRFVILTTAANDSISDIHNRMPVCLDNYETWLRGGYESILYRGQAPSLTRKLINNT